MMGSLSAAPPLRRYTATEFINPVDRITVPGIQTVPYPLYPPERAVADKLCGIIERYDGHPSSRVKAILKKELGVIVHWSLINKEDYFLANRAKPRT